MNYIYHQYWAMHHLSRFYDFTIFLSLSPFLFFFPPAKMKEKKGTKKENSKGAKETKDYQLYRVYFSWGFNFWGRISLDFNWNNAIRTALIRINSWSLITERSVARAAELMILNYTIDSSLISITVAPQATRLMSSLEAFVVPRTR